MNLGKVNINSLDAGVYLMQTTSEALYQKKAAEAHKRFNQLHRGTTLDESTIDGKIKDNLVYCNKIFKVIREPFTKNRPTLVTIIEDGKILPNTIIEKVWTEAEGKVLYPEYFL